MLGRGEELVDLWVMITGKWPGAAFPLESAGRVTFASSVTPSDIWIGTFFSVTAPG